MISFFFNRAGEQKKRADKQRKPNSPEMREVQPRQEERRKPPTNQPIEEKAKPVVTERPRSLREAAEILLSQMQPQIEEKKAEADNKIEELQKRAEVFEKKARDLQKQAETVREKKTEEPPIESLFQKDDIVKGIIMSEVLGPPRAKRRYDR